MFSETILAANVAALERAQGQRPTLARLDETRTRAVADGAGGVRLELRTSTGAWLPFRSPRLATWPRQLIVVGAALGEVLDDLERAGAATRVVLVEPDAGIPDHAHGMNGFIFGKDDQPGRIIRRKDLVDPADQ